MAEPRAEQDLEVLLDYLRRSRGFDFTGYKRTSLSRRIDKRMQAVGADSYLGYLDHLEVDPEEFTQLFNTILINVTGFFRDTDAWDYLRSEVVESIIAGNPVAYLGYLLTLCVLAVMGAVWHDPTARRPRVRALLAAVAATALALFTLAATTGNPDNRDSDPNPSRVTS